MCGIAGFWGEIAKTPDASVRLERITATLRHRGPDGTSRWLGKNAGLGHTRLAVIDLLGGEQPLWDANKRYVIVFNGEIYNHKELRQQLGAKGYAFRTRSDTEVIPAVIDAWGIGHGLQKLRGMFAFALYDTKTDRMLLARDRVGIKPLYWAMTSKGFMFASEQKALLASGMLSRRANPVAIHDFLAQGYPTTPSTCWADIQLMEPGTWFEIGPEGMRNGRYWEWTPKENHALDIEGAAQKMKGKLQDTLRCHLMSDVPVGVFLSGGLDSSLIVALLSKGLASEIPTFNMGFGDSAYNESGDARRVAEYCATVHYESRMENGEADPDLFRVILEQFDEPFGDISSIPLFLICRQIREHVKVVLSGDGGDEILGGYLRYLYARRLANLGCWRQVLRPLTPMFSFFEHRLGSVSGRIGKAARFAQLARDEMLCALHTCFTEDERFEMYEPDFARLARSEGPTSSRFASFVPKNLDDPVQQLIAAEMRLRLHASYLRKVDIASSAHGLEVRVPYLDNEMLELSAELPARLKIAFNGETKILSRRLASSLLPPGIAAKRKQGFDPPLDRWIGAGTREFLRDLLLDSTSGISTWLKQSAVRRIWSDFDNGETARHLTRDQRSHRAFLLASLELWLSRWNPALS